MKIPFQHRSSAMSLLDVVIVIATIAFMVTFFLKFYPRQRNRKSANRITCLNNLREIGLSFRLYSGDNRDRFPTNISTNDEPVVNEATPVYQYLKLISTELGSPRLVICPSDTRRRFAADFTNFNNSNVGYFIGLDSDENHPNSLLAGDRNITNGFPPKDGILKLTTNQNVRFTKEIHIEQGNVALGDGSAWQVSSTRLRSEIIHHTGFATNRIVLP